MSEKYYAKVARETGCLFSWTTHYSMSVAGEFCLYLQNTDPVLTLCIESLSLSATQNGFFTPQAVTGTASGATVTGAPWNGELLQVAKANSLNGGVGGLIAVGTPSNLRVGANAATQKFDVDGAFRLAENGAVAVKFSVVADVEVTIVGYYE
jgi:hypothetical protein